MHSLIKIIRNDDGDIIDNPKWCLTMATGEAPRTLCTGEAFGYGESRAEFEHKIVKRGGITCRQCMNELLSYKSVKL